MAGPPRTPVGLRCSTVRARARRFTRQSGEVQPARRFRPSVRAARPHRIFLLFRVVAGAPWRVSTLCEPAMGAGDGKALARHSTGLRGRGLGGLLHGDKNLETCVHSRSHIRSGAAHHRESNYSQSDSPVAKHGIRYAHGLILGTGSLARQIFSALARSPQFGLDPVGFVVDDPQEWGREIYECSYQRKSSAKVLAGLLTPELLHQAAATVLVIAVQDMDQNAINKDRGAVLDRGYQHLFRSRGSVQARGPHRIRGDSTGSC